MIYKLLLKLKKTKSRIEGHIISRFVMNNLGVKVSFNGYGTFKFRKRNDVSLGTNIHIGSNFYIRAEGKLAIGDNTHISRNFKLYTHNHNYQGNKLPYDDTFVYKPVNIGKNVWIGTDVIILPGANIGDGCIVGAGSVVSGTYDELSIIVGNPAKVVKKRNSEHYFSLNSLGLYGGANGQ